MKTTEFAKKIFGASNIKSIQPINYNYRWQNKIAVYVPIGNTDELTFRMAAAGAGLIGNYSVCSFRSKGVGTFIGGSSSKPAAGKKGSFEMVDEVRLEMLCDSIYLDDAIDTMYEVHPYEEPAYEIYPVMIRDRNANDSTIAVSFKKKPQLDEVLKKINSIISTENLKRVAGGTEIWSAVIDFTGAAEADSARGGKKKVLYITRNLKGSYNIQLV